MGGADVRQVFEAAPLACRAHPADSTTNQAVAFRPGGVKIRDDCRSGSGSFVMFADIEFLA
jgi:hypothetical protein